MSITKFYINEQIYLIIEFLDSVGIYIDVNSQINDNNELTFQSNIFHKGEYKHYISCENRIDSLLEAIKQSENIYVL